MDEQISRKQARVTAITLGMVGFLLGLIIGLPILGWWLWPVQWTDIPQPPSATPYPTFTPYPTPRPYPSPTPGPEAFVMGNIINLFEGPGTQYAVTTQLNPREPLVVLGQNANCSWLKVSSTTQTTGWISNDSSSLLLFKPCAGLPNGTYRPLTGVLQAPLNIGEGQLNIENHDIYDMVIALVDPNNPGATVAAAYIRHGETVTLTGVPDGTYDQYIAFGSEWRDDTDRFTVDEVVEKASEPIQFTTTTLKYTIWTLTFNPLEGGNTALDPVLPQVFPDINQ